MGNEEHKSPEEERADRFESLRSRWTQYSSRVTLGHLRDKIEDTEGQIEALPGQIEELRRRGYRYSRDWEGRAETVKKGWPKRNREARRLLRERANSMKDLAKVIEDLCGRGRLSDQGLDRLETKLDQLDSQIDSAESDVRGSFDALEGQLHELQYEFRPVEYMLDSLDNASFDLYPDEHGVAACKAIWLSGPDEPEGILFLTDGRLIFEHFEKKAKKKVLFITTESELVQEKLWEAPVGALKKLEAEDKRKFLSKKQLLYFRLAEGSPTEATIQLKGTTNEEWVGLISRIQNGEIEADRYDLDETEKDAAAPPPPEEIPTKCSTCGAKLPTVFKGMREITCDYCGSLMRF